MRTFQIITFGCTLNHADSLRIRKVMLDAGWKESEKSENSDIIIVNTCGVKHTTEQKILNLLRRFYDQKKKVIVTGCLAHNVKLILSSNPDVSILGTQSLLDFPDTAEKLMRNEKVISLQGMGKHHTIAEPLPGTIIHPVTVQEGCMNRCTYCFTKFARHRLISYPIKNIKYEIERAVAQGVREIQLTGQDTGAYRYNGKTIVDVLKEICSIEGNFKVRLGMINPEHVIRLLNDLIDVYSNHKMYKFFHIPVQSGSDAVLSHMKRRYTVSEFRDIVKKIRRSFDDVTIATDFIVGYPTETEYDFKKSLELIKELEFDIVNVSMFSPRPFTEAAKLKKLPTQVVKNRSKEMSNLVDSIILKKNKNRIGKEYTVLITEKGSRQNQVKGRTDAYHQVIINKNIPLGTIVKSVITGYTQTSLIAQVIK